MRTLALAAFALAGLSACETLRGPGNLPVASTADFDPNIGRDMTCFAEIGTTLSEKDRAACEELGERKFYHGLWIVGFEANGFSFAGTGECYTPEAGGICLDLRGDALIWPPRWACLRKYEIEFVGRRYLHPVGGHLGAATYAVAVEKVLSKKRLPNPTFPQGDCEP